MYHIRLYWYTWCEKYEGQSYFLDHPTTLHLYKPALNIVPRGLERCLGGPVYNPLLELSIQTWAETLWNMIVGLVLIFFPWSTSKYSIIPTGRWYVRTEAFVRRWASKKVKMATQSCHLVFVDNCPTLKADFLWLGNLEQACY